MFMWFYYKYPPPPKGVSLRQSQVEGHDPDRKPAEQLIDNNQKKVRISVQKSVDFVLVYRSARTDTAFNEIETFVFNLEEKGFILESSVFSLNDEINFIKIHAPLSVLVQYAKAFHIELAFQTLEPKIKPNRVLFKFMANELTDPKSPSPVLERAKNSLLRRTPKTVTPAEKGLIIYKVLSRTFYGVERHEYGIKNLIKRGVFEAAFPIHDGSFEWSDEGPLNDLQLLAKFWGNFNCWYKQQPLDLIEKYFGPETGFYFAWLGFYIKMLLPISVIGFVLFSVGIAKYYREKILTETCKSDILLCPRCIVKHCKYEPLKNSCLHATLMQLLDHPLVIIYAAAMSVWSTVFLALWRRKQAILQIRWNLRSVEADYSMRPEFEEKTVHRRVSAITGILEPYTLKREMCYRFIISYAVVLLLLLLLTLGLFGIVVYVKILTIIMTRKGISVELDIAPDVSLFAPVLRSISSVILILIADPFYRPVAYWLTQMENPRTQIDFDNSFTYKCYALSFVNNYGVIFYIAFLKAQFYSYPGDQDMWSTIGGLRSDLCDPGGCIIELGIQMFFVFMVKNIFRTARKFIAPYLLMYIHQRRKNKSRKMVATDQWERDYLKVSLSRYRLMSDHLQMIIQYGFVTFFVAAFPPAPFFALIINIVQLRLDAYKTIRAFRRPIAFKVPNIRALNKILGGMIYLGTAVNAFIIAFTSEFVQRNIYYYTVNHELKGYVNSLLSAYNVSDFPSSAKVRRNISVCYYPGQRYPPNHPRKYELTDNHWYILTGKFLTVIIFEHFVLLITKIISYMIPDIPFSVKQHGNYQKQHIKKYALKIPKDTVSIDKNLKRIDFLSEI